MSYSPSHHTTCGKWLLIKFLTNLHIFILLLYSIVSPPSTSMVLAQTRSVTYLENSEYELKIYFINGREPGKTMMIIGGIQGDEPGGYLAADLYADMLLEKGNLIVVPRANFNSIKFNKRGINGDMNRKFSLNESGKNDNDLIIVETLKSIIEKSDILLNLHDGSGFFYPEYISDMRNPMRYGQSIIADAPHYTCLDGEYIDLEGPALLVIEHVNRNIKNPDHYFHFNNHNTLSQQSKHKEQRKSATFHALTVAGIPAFGVETSKSITSIETKVKYQTLVINSFMGEYGIIPEHPSVFLPAPELEHLVIEIIGFQNPFAVKNGHTLTIPAGSSIHVPLVVANYERGLSIDILGVGSTNDMGLVAPINHPTTIRVYKDAYLCGEVAIAITPQETSPVKTSSPGHLKQVEINIDSKNVVVSDSDTLHIVRGDMIKIVNARTTDYSQSGFRVNFVGFEGWKLGGKKFNDAEDRGYYIDTDKDLLRRFSLNNSSSLYQIKAETLTTKKLIGTVYIAIDEPEIDYMIVEREDGTKIALVPGSVVRCKENERFKVLSVISNITAKPYTDTFILKRSSQPEKIEFPAVLEMTSETDIQFRRSTHSLGSISFRISG